MSNNRNINEFHPRAQSQTEPYSDFGEIRIALVGKTGNGKSASANTLFGEIKFKEDVSWSAVTLKCQSEKKKIGSTQLVIIDTPGACDTHRKRKELVEEMKTCMGLGKPGLHAVIIVLSLTGPFLDEDTRCLKEYTTIFGNHFFNYAILLFTHIDVIDDKNISLTEKLCSAPEKLKNFIHKCGCRFTAFDNKSTDACKKQAQVRSLITLIENVRFSNSNKYLTLGDIDRAGNDEMAITYEIPELQTRIHYLEEKNKYLRARRKAKSEEIKKLKQELKEKL